MTERTFAYPKKVWVAVREYLKERYPEYEDCLTVHSLAAWSLWYGPTPLSEQRAEFADYPGDLKAVDWIRNRLEELGVPDTLYFLTDSESVVEELGVNDYDCGDEDCEESHAHSYVEDHMIIETLKCICCEQVLENLG